MKQVVVLTSHPSCLTASAGCIYIGHVVQASRTISIIEPVSPSAERPLEEEKTGEK